MDFADGRIWQRLFAVAEGEELAAASGREDSGLLPYWGATKGDALVPVERYAYLYPFSRDVILNEWLVG